MCRWQKYFEKISTKVCRNKISSYICSAIKNKETMTKQEFNNRYKELQNKMRNVKTHASKNKYTKLMLDLSNEYRISNNLKPLY